jgi:hypothetical protein
MLENFELLPHEAREDFVGIYESLELQEPMKTHEYILAAEATKLIWNIRRLERFELAILDNQRPAAAEAMFRKTLGVKGSISVSQYFVSPEFKEKSDKDFEEAGYAPDAVEAEAYLRAMSPLATIHRQKAVDRKALVGLLKELKLQIASRNRNKSAPPSNSSKKRAD